MYNGFNLKHKMEMRLLYYIIIRDKKLRIIFCVYSFENIIVNITYITYTHIKHFVNIIYPILNEKKLPQKN